MRSGYLAAEAITTAAGRLVHFLQPESAAHGTDASSAEVKLNRGNLGALRVR